MQLGLPAVWTAARDRGVTLTELARWMATAPAELVGLTDRGAIAPGRRADLAIVAPDETFVVDPARLRHRNPITPYAGMTLRGVVHETWLGGEPVRDGETGEGRARMTEARICPISRPALLGGTVVYANDESFASAHNLLTDGPASHDVAAFDLRGKVYDGWETRRRRERRQSTSRSCGSASPA